MSKILDALKKISVSGSIEKSTLDQIDSNKNTILLIDDDLLMRNGFKQKYSSLYNVLIAESGQKGLELVHQHDVDAVILDIVLENQLMDGYKIREELLKSNPEIPVIFLTGYAKNQKFDDVLRLHRPYGFFDKKSDEDQSRLEILVQSAVQQSTRARSDREFIHKIKIGESTSRQYLDYNLDSIVEGKPYTQAWDNGIMLITDFNYPDVVVGVMPDMDKERIDYALKKTFEAQIGASKRSIMDNLDILKLAGEILEKDGSYDGIIARTNNCPKKIVTSQRHMAAIRMKRSKEYLINGPFKKEQVDNDLIRGIGPVGAFCQSSMFITGAYTPIEAVGVGNAVFLKLDSRDPYAQHQVSSAINNAWIELANRGKISAEGGPPIQIVSWNTTSNPELGRYVMNKLQNVFMGDPRNLIELLFGFFAKQMHLHGYQEIELQKIMGELRPYNNVISYLRHLGLDYVDKSADLNTAIVGSSYSTISDNRSCKRSGVKVVHPDIYDSFLSGFVSYLSALRVGDTTENNIDIPVVLGSNHNTVLKKLKTIYNSGNVIMGNNISEQGVKGIEIEASTIEDPYIRRALSTEYFYPVFQVIKGDQKLARKIMGIMGHGEKMLECAVFTQDYDLFKREFIQSHKMGEDFACSYHLNQPTTWGLGNPQDNNFIPRDHERTWLAQQLSRTTADK